MNTQGETCVICRVALSPHDRSLLCADLRCRWTYESLPAFQLCSVCRRPLAQAQLALQHCDRLACSQEMARRRLEEERRRHEELKRQLTVLRDRIGEQLGIASSQSYPLMLVPNYTTPILPVPADRREAFATHLAGLFAEALANPGEAPAVPETAPLPPEAGAILGRGCATCRGECCRLGSTNRAFLTVDSIRRVLRTFPERTSDELLAEYLAHIQDAHEGSCVYHTATGCALSREMRSDTCNTYLCKPLSAWRDQLLAGGEPRAFIVSVGRSLRGEFTDGTDSVPLPAEMSLTEDDPS